MCGIASCNNLFFLVIHSVFDLLSALVLYILIPYSSIIGRPVPWGLAYDGEQGVEKVFKVLKNEHKTAMMLSGIRESVDSLYRDDTGE